MGNREKNWQKGLVVLDKIIIVIWLTPWHVLCPCTEFRFDHFISAPPTRGGGKGCLGSAVGGEGHESLLHCVVCWRLSGLWTVLINSLRAQRPQGCMLEVPVPPGSFLRVCVLLGGHLFMQ